MAKVSLNKKILLVGFILISTLVTFSQEFIALLVDIQLERASQNYLGVVLEYRELEFTKDGFILKGVKNQDAEDKSLSFEGELEVNYQLEVWNRRILVDFFLNQSKLTTSSIDGLLKGITTPSSKLSSMFHVYPKLSINQASCLLRGEQDKEVKFTLDLEQKIRDSSDFYVKVAFESEGNHPQYLELDVSDRYHYLAFDSTFSETPVEKLSHLLSLTYPGNVFGKVTKGIVNGSFSFDLFAGSRLRIGNSALDISHLDLSHPSYNLHLSKVACEISPMIRTALQRVEEVGEDVTLSQQLLDAIQRFDFLDNQSILVFKGLENEDIRLDALMGRAERKAGSDLIFDFHGKASNPEGGINFSLNGRSFLNHQFFRNIQGSLSLQEESKRDALVSYVFKELELNKQVLEFSFYAFPADLISFAFPYSKEDSTSWEISDGDFYGKYTLLLDNGKLSKIYSSDFKAENLIAQSKSFSLKVGSFNGDISWDFLEKDGKQLSLDLAVQKTDLSNLSFGWGYLPFKDIEGKIAVNRGRVDKASLWFFLDSMKAKVLWDRGLPSEPLSFSCEGKVQDIIKKIEPDKYLKGMFSTAYLESDFFIDGKGNFANRNFLLSGGISLAQKQYLEDAIRFKATFASNFNTQSLVEAASVKGFAKAFLVERASFMGYFLHELEFLGLGVDVEQFVSPYIVDKEDNMFIKGKGNAQGLFKNGGLLLEYEAKDAEIENEDFVITCPSLAEQSDQLSGFRAKHFFDFIRDEHQGYIPIQGAQYYDKHYGMLFTDVTTSAYLVEKKMNFEQAIATFDGMKFSGKFELDLTAEDRVVFSVRPSGLDGDLSQAQRFLSRIVEAKEGELIAKGPFSLDTSSYLDITFLESDNLIDLYLKGRMLGSSMDIQEQNINLFSLDGSFAFNLLNKQLNLLFDKGELSVKKEGTAKASFYLANSFLDFTNLPYWKCCFDINLEKNQRAHTRFSGETYPTANEDGAVYRFSFDHMKTHIGAIYPRINECSLRDWEELIAFQATPEISFKTLFKDLSTLSDLQLISFAKDMPKVVTDYPLLGDAKGELIFDKVSNLFHYNFSAKDVAIGPITFDSFLIIGKGRDDRLLINELYSDDLFLTADIEKVGDFTRLNYLKAYLDKGIQLHIKEAFQNSSLGIEAALPSVDIDFDFIKKKYKWLKEDIAKLLPQGQVKLQGNMNLEFQDQSEWELKSSWEVLAQQLSFMGKEIEEISPFKYQLFSSGDSQVSDGSITFKANAVKKDFLSVNLGKLRYIPKKSAFLFRQSRLHTSASNIDFLLSVMEQLQDEGHYSEYREHLDHFVEKKSDSLSFEFSGDLSEKESDFYIAFQDGSYESLGCPLELEEFSLSKENALWSLDFVSPFSKRKLAFSILNDPKIPFLQAGSAKISLLDSPQDNNLLFTWKRSRELLDIENGQGHLPGLSLMVKKDEVLSDDKELVLQGSLNLDFKELKEYLPEQVEKGIEKLGLGAGYVLEGEAFIKRSADEEVVFKGSLKGKDFEVFESKLDKLFSKIELRPSRLQIFETFAKDKLGDFYVDTITLAETKDKKWELSIPLIRVEDFYPKLFGAVEKSRKNQSMMVSLGELRGLRGIIGEDESFVGKGVVEFKNVSKAFFFTPLLMIPGEIIARIGLDPNVISPHMGTIFFEFGDGVVYVQEFRDVFSKGRRSKFYLADDQPSYINFDGSLNIRIKIEHYSLILKPLDLTTITMKGKLSKPIYTIQKQQNQEIVKVGQNS